MIKLITTNSIIQTNILESNLTMSVLISDMQEYYKEELKELRLEIDDYCANKIIEFTKQYKTNKFFLRMDCPVTVDLNQLVDDWYINFLDISIQDLFELLRAADYLVIEELSDLICTKIALILKNQTNDEIKDFFELKDFTPEEEILFETTKKYLL